MKHMYKPAISSDYNTSVPNIFDGTKGGWVSKAIKNKITIGFKSSVEISRIRLQWWGSKRSTLSENSPRTHLGSGQKSKLGTIVPNLSNFRTSWRGGVS